MFRLLAGARSPTGAILATEADWELNAGSRQRAGLPELSQRAAQCPAVLPNLAWRRILNSRAPGGLNISTAQSRQGGSQPHGCLLVDAGGAGKRHII